VGGKKGRSYIQNTVHKETNVLISGGKGGTAVHEFRLGSLAIKGGRGGLQAGIWAIRMDKEVRSLFGERKTTLREPQRRRGFGF